MRYPGIASFAAVPYLAIRGCLLRSAPLFATGHPSLANTGGLRWAPRPAQNFEAWLPPPPSAEGADPNAAAGSKRPKHPSPGPRKACGARRKEKEGNRTDRPPTPGKLRPILKGGPEGRIGQGLLHAGGDHQRPFPLQGQKRNWIFCGPKGKISPRKNLPPRIQGTRIIAKQKLNFAIRSIGKRRRPAI